MSACRICAHEQAKACARCDQSYCAAHAEHLFVRTCAVCTLDNVFESQTRLVDAHIDHMLILAIDPAINRALYAATGADCRNEEIIERARNNVLCSINELRQDAITVSMPPRKRRMVVRRQDAPRQPNFVALP